MCSCWLLLLRAEMRAAQGLRWTADGTARHVVSAIASVRCQDLDWSFRDVPAQLKGHGKEGEEEEEEEKEGRKEGERRRKRKKRSWILV